jgi:hypothetical protein
MRFDKFFALAGYNGANNQTIQAGAAARIKKYYIALWYNGNIAGKTSGGQQTETNIAYLGNDIPQEGYSQLSEHVTVPLSSANTAALLFGVGAMGFKLGFDEKTYLSYENTDSYFIQGPDDFKIGNYINKYFNKHNYITPSIDWGMKLSIGNFVLKPSAGFALRAEENRYAVEYSLYQDNPATPPLGAIIGYRAIGSAAGETLDSYSAPSEKPAYSLIQPDFYAQIGLDLPKGEKSQQSVSLKYRGQINLYSIDYEDIDGARNVKGWARWAVLLDSTDQLAAGTKVDVHTIEQSLHTISPEWKYTRTAGSRLSLGALVNIALGFNHTSDKGVTEEYKDATHYTSAAHDVEKDVISVAPAFALALQVAAIPDTLTVNIGLRTSAKYTSTNEIKTDWGTVTTHALDGSATSEIYPDRKTSVQDYEWSGFTNEIGLGLTWNIIPKLSLDMSFSISASREIEFAKIASFTLNAKL